MNKEIKNALDILDIAISATGVTLDQIITQNRTRKFADARKIAMSLCRDYTFLPFEELGFFFERERTTIVHACETARQLIGVDLGFAKNYLQAKDEVEKLGLKRIKIERKKGSRVPQSINQAA